MKTYSDTGKSYSSMYQQKIASQQQQDFNPFMSVSGKHNFVQAQRTLVKPNQYTSSYQRPQTSPFANSEILKENLKQIHDLRTNSPTFRRNNPITADGHPEKIFRSSVKSTEFSNIDNISFPPPPQKESKKSASEFGYLLHPSEQKIWKPSVRQVCQKESEHYEVFEKRGYKPTQITSGATSSKNPLLGQDIKIIKPRMTGNGDQVISVEYQKIADRRQLASQHSPLKAKQWEKYKMSNIFTIQSPERLSSPVKEVKDGVPNKFRGGEAKNLLGYEYALPFSRVKELTDKVNRAKDRRYISFTEVNDYDFRRQSNRLAKEEQFAFNSQKDIDVQQSQINQDSLKSQ